VSTILHIVNQSPFASTVLKQCIDRINNNDGLVLLEDGVYSATSQHPFVQDISNITRCYAIKNDLLARGINLDDVLDNIQLIDYDDFVKLTIEFPLSHSWY
jgi:tRNA 2-thiouridine synthesizing protein B